MRNLVREWAHHNIRVNTLVPGFFPAEQNRKILDGSRVDQMLAGTPANRFGQSEDVIGAASSGAGSIISGVEMIVDGGFNVYTIQGHPAREKLDLVLVLKSIAVILCGCHETQPLSLIHI